MFNEIKLAKVHCGLFGVSNDFSEEYQSLDERFIKNKVSTFFFEAVGSSMEPLIFERDVLIVDRSIEERNNKVVVVALDGELICKRIIKGHNSFILRSENSNCKDIVVALDRDLIVWGVVTGIAREI